VTVKAGFGTIQKLTFGSASKPIQNATVETLHPSSFITGTTGTFTPMDGATEVAFVVRRTNGGLPVMIPLTVEDACGSWQTFVGGGTGAF
jgi:hypothetical protein